MEKRNVSYTVNGEVTELLVEPNALFINVLRDE
jgi:aerobic-type carbon monoxide dehydrogenase small subunit (CoxS/CutS family)